MKRDRTSIVRRIYFYRICAGYDLAGVPIQYDVRSALEAINKLSFQTDTRYLEDEDGFEVCCWVDELNPPQRAQFGKIRRDDLPQIEHRGDLTDLPLPEESGLAECTHVMFFPENIVGLEYNYDGPKVTGIREYLQAKSQGTCSQMPVFEQLLQRDVIKKLERMRIVRKFSLKVRPSLFSSMKEIDDSLAQAFETTRELTQAQEIELVLSAGRRKGSLDMRVRDIAKRLLTLRDATNDVIGGEIKGRDETGKMEIIDLLNAKLVAEKSIPRHQTRTGVPQSEQVYVAINEAYNELKSQLLSAVGVTLCPV